MPRTQVMEQMFQPYDTTVHSDVQICVLAWPGLGALMVVMFEPDWRYENLTSSFEESGSRKTRKTR